MRRRLSLWGGIGLVVVLGAIGVWYYQRMQLTPPTALSLDPTNLAQLSPPTISPDVVVATQPSDASNDYRQAWVDYQANTDPYDQFAQNPADPPPLAVALILDAAGKSSAQIFSDHPSEIVDYQADHSTLDQLCDLGRVLERAGLVYHLRKQNDMAEKYFQAVYALGQRLYDERITYDEYSKGVALMNEAAVALADSSPPDRAQQLRDFEGKMRDYDTNHVQPIYQALNSAQQEDIAEHTGDIFAFATKSKERVFRIEAVLALGRLKFDAARTADQDAAQRFIDNAASDPDSAVQAAATAAQGLTLDEYRMIH
jgi:hypothetical protein